MLTKLLLPAFKKNAEKYAVALASKYGTLEHIAIADEEDIAELLSDPRAASFIRVAISLTVRRVTDSFKLGKKHTESEIKNYLKALYLNVSVETVYLLCFDSQDRVISCDYMGDGTVNYSSVFPRKLIECAMKRNAASVTVAHNHPSGNSVPSPDDKATSSTLFDLFNSSRIKLKHNYVVAGGAVSEIPTSFSED